MEAEVGGAGVGDVDEEGRVQHRHRVDAQPLPAKDRQVRRRSGERRALCCIVTTVNGANDGD